MKLPVSLWFSGSWTVSRTPWAGDQFVANGFILVYEFQRWKWCYEEANLISILLNSSVPQVCVKKKLTVALDICNL
jgi:hypothetical protein